MKKIQKLTLLVLIIGGTYSCNKQASEVPIDPQNIQPQDSMSGFTKLAEPAFNASNFVTGINNPYFPLSPGTVYYYLNTEVEGSHLTVSHLTLTVLPNLKNIMGVNCEIVHDEVKTKGITTEDTYDWYAQDKSGNVWYFGEDTKKLTDTGWSTLGSWEAGVDGAKPGIIMHAKPNTKIGQVYYQEFYKNFAEDQAVVQNADIKTIIGLGTFSNCVKTKEFSRLLPGDIANKYYAPGIGEILTLETKGVNVSEELVKIVHH